MAAASNGRIMHIGANPVVHNREPQEPPSLTKLHNLILKNLTIRGIIVGSRRMFEDLIQAMTANDIKPVIDRVLRLGTTSSVQSTTCKAARRSASS